MKCRFMFTDMRECLIPTTSSRRNSSCNNYSQVV